MDYKLEKRICLSKNCNKTFKTFPNSPAIFCQKNCQYVNGNKKKSHQEIKEFHGKFVRAALKKNQGVGYGKRNICTGL